jgi:molecular chaperone Hsp33
MRTLVDGLEGLEVVPFWERDPEFLIRWINLGEGAEIQSSLDLHYRCRCSKATILAALTTVPRSQLEELFPAAGPVEICCDYCGLRYLVTKDEVPESGSMPGETEHG